MTQFNTYYRAGLEEILPFPEVFLIDTVSHCNLRCSMCVHSKMKRKKGFMAFDVYKKAIDEIAQKNKKARIWNVFFGDPYMRVKQSPSIFDLIKYAKEQGLEDVVLNTNACLLNETNMLKTIESGLDAIYIGLDGFSEKTYSENRVGGDYEQTKKNVLRLLEYQQKNSIKKPEVFVQFVELDNNIEERDAFVKFWTEQGANVKVRPMVTWIGKIERKIMTEEVEERKPCSWAMNSMVIGEDGRIANCACDLDIEYVFGNIMEQSIEEIWNTSMKEFRIKHLERKFNELHDLYKNCRDWQASGQQPYSAKK